MESIRVDALIIVGKKEPKFFSFFFDESLGKEFSRRAEVIRLKKPSEYYKFLLAVL